MSRRKALAVAVVILLTAIGANAKVEFGVSGGKYWSNNTYLDDHRSWGISLSKSISQKVGLRVSFERIDHNFRLFQTIYPYTPLIKNELESEFVRYESSGNFWDLILTHSLVIGDKMRLDIGGGFATAYWKLFREGQSSGFRFTSDEGNLMVTYLIETTVDEFFGRFLALKFGYQHRRSILPGGMAGNFSGAFDELVISHVRAAIVAQW